METTIENEVEDTEKPEEEALDTAPCYAFRVRQKVWTMRYDKPAIGIVYAILLKPRWGAMGPVEATYLVYHATSLCSVTEENCERYSEKNVFPTKSELIASLF